MEFVRNYVMEIDWQAITDTMLRILLILIIVWIAIKLLKKVLGRLEQHLVLRGQIEGEPPTESAKRVNTLINLVRQAIYLAIWITVILVVLREVGLDIAPLLAGAGILGLAVGFGAQNLVRDIITGFFIIMENQIRVGDVAIVNNTGGLVEQINFRTIVLRDLSGVVHIFPNGTVTTLSNMTQEWSAYVFELGVAYKEDTDQVTEVIRDVCTEMQSDEIFGPLILEEAEMFGVEKFGDSAVIIKGRIKTKPIRQWSVGREFNRRVKFAFDAKGIEIPFPHRTLYAGEATKPFDLRLMEKLDPKSLLEEQKE